MNRTINGSRSRYTCARVHSRACFCCRSQEAQFEPHDVLFTFLKCFSHTDLCIHKPDGLRYEVIKTVNVKLAEAAATER